MAGKRGFQVSDLRATVRPSRPAVVCACGGEPRDPVAGNRTLHRNETTDASGYLVLASPSPGPTFSMVVGTSVTPHLTLPLASAERVTFCSVAGLGRCGTGPPRRTARAGSTIPGIECAGDSSRASSAGGALEATFASPGGDTHYLVVPRNASQEGSYGADGLGDERPPGFAARPPQAIACP